MLLLSNKGIKPTWLLRETGNSALEADPRIPPNKKKTYNLANFVVKSNICSCKRSLKQTFYLRPTQLDAKLKTVWKPF